MRAVCDKGHQSIEIGTSVSVVEHLKCGICGKPMILEVKSEPYMTVLEWERLDKYMREAATAARPTHKADLDRIGGVKLDPIVELFMMATTLLYMGHFRSHLKHILTGLPYEEPPQGKKPPIFETPIPKL